MTNVAIIWVARDRRSIAWGGITLLKEIGTSKNKAQLSGYYHL